MGSCKSNRDSHIQMTLLCVIQIWESLLLLHDPIQLAMARLLCVAVVFCLSKYGSTCEYMNNGYGGE